MQFFKLHLVAYVRVGFVQIFIAAAISTSSLFFIAACLGTLFDFLVFTIILDLISLDPLKNRSRVKRSGWRHVEIRKQRGADEGNNSLDGGEKILHPKGSLFIWDSPSHTLRAHLVNVTLQIPFPQKTGTFWLNEGTRPQAMAARSLQTPFIAPLTTVC